MRSLFLKILAWFWLASALVLLAQFITTEVTRREERRPPPSSKWRSVSVMRMSRGHGMWMAQS